MNSLFTVAVAAGIALWMFITFSLNRRAWWVWFSLHIAGVTIYALIKDIVWVRSLLSIVGLGVVGIIIGVIVYYIIRQWIYYFAWEKFIFEDDLPPRDDYDSL